MSLLRIDNLGISLGERSLVEGITLVLKSGEIGAITGESGSGKSLTALALMQLLPAGMQASGKVYLEGTDLLRCGEDELCSMRGSEMAMVFQEPMTALNPVQTIGQQVMEVLVTHGTFNRARARRRAEEVLARVGLPAEKVPLSRYPHQLSGGQRQRVVIAMAIALRPRLLIADEPTTALDVTVQAQILDLLTRLVREEGMAMLLITHDLAVVADRADKIAIMQKGRIVECGPTAHLLSNLEQPYSRALFDASQYAPELPPAPPPSPLLALEGVVREYTRPRRSLLAAAPKFRAVDQVSFEIARGERVGLVGESGCGKSTLTRAILGLEPVQGGRITLEGAPVFSGAKPDMAQRRKMQVVFQDPYGSFNPRHRVGRILEEPFHLVPDPPTGAAREALIEAALAEVGIDPGARRRFVHEFSGGQRQRIAIARALIIRPELIIFDEPVSALDVSVRAQVLDLIADLCRSHGLTYLFISHDLSVVRSVTDRVLVMRAGQIVEQGPTHQVFDAPQHDYTRMLVEAAPRLPDDLKELYR